ncbi:hypothetical protein ACTACG_21260 [Pseudomonas syringae]|uniref:hypothetical protein n=1 Tax=Pseudomonas syringae TaxID=317 RepID=UPI000AE47C34|nr:hypothetical protein [Pseudomonas syringae]
MAKPSFITVCNEYLKISTMFELGKPCDGHWKNQYARLVRGVGDQKDYTALFDW